MDITELRVVAWLWTRRWRNLSENLSAGLGSVGMGVVHSDPFFLKYKTGEKMRKLISGLVGILWGGAMLVYWGLAKGAENTGGIAIGAVIFVAGLYYLNRWRNSKK